MFTAALFTIGKTEGKSKCPSTDEQIKKMWRARAHTQTHTDTHRHTHTHRHTQTHTHTHNGVVLRNKKPE